MLVKDIAYLAFFDERRIGSTDCLKERLALAHDVADETHQSDNAAVLSCGGSGLLTKPCGSSAADHPAVGMREDNDIQLVVFRSRGG